MDAAAYLADARLQFQKLKQLADAAVAQIPEGKLFQSPDAVSNSIAVTMKHVAGNMRSRWTDFLTTDGEKPDRHRDEEFQIREGQDRDWIEARWEDGWARLSAAIDGLQPADLERTVTIRQEPHTVLQAINRQMTHYAYHVGQIVFLARSLAGDGWHSLSIPRGRSQDWEVAKDGKTYRP